ncbi:hypothetical protein KI387_037866, partial [Taxus chinensis]
WKSKSQEHVGGVGKPDAKEHVGRVEKPDIKANQVSEVEKHVRKTRIGSMSSHPPSPMQMHKEKPEPEWKQTRCKNTVRHFRVGW